MNDGVTAALIHAARAGSVSAAFILGRLYDEAWGIKKDPKRAFRWYEKAARGGLREAFYFVASAYAFGHGVRKNSRTAHKWFRRASAAGDLDAAYMYALNLFEGIGVRRDARRGYRLLLAAARRGSHDAMDYLAAHYLKLGRPKLAKRWAERAIRAGDEVTRLRLPEIERLRRERQRSGNQ